MCGSLNPFFINRTGTVEGNGDDFSKGNNHQFSDKEQKHTYRFVGIVVCHGTKNKQQYTHQDKNNTIEEEGGHKIVSQFLRCPKRKRWSTRMGTFLWRKSLEWMV